MRKTVLSVVACCAVIAIVPASALAHGRHHVRHHRAHHARIHHWGHDNGVGQGQTQNASPAGTVQSFTGGVLTIALANGQTVSGDVTGDTEIKCESADTSNTMSSHDRSGGNDRNNGEEGDDDQGQGDDDNNNAMCSSSDLTTGAPVQAASLLVTSAGAVWQRIVLVSQSSQSTQSTQPSDS
jgi:hypothetical protein